MSRSPSEKNLPAYPVPHPAPDFGAPPSPPVGAALKRTSTPPGLQRAPALPELEDEAPLPGSRADDSADSEFAPLSENAADMGYSLIDEYTDPEPPPSEPPPGRLRTPVIRAGPPPADRAGRESPAAMFSRPPGTSTPFGGNRPDGQWSDRPFPPSAGRPFIPNRPFPPVDRGFSPRPPPDPPFMPNGPGRPFSPAGRGFSPRPPPPPPPPAGLGNYSMRPLTHRGGPNYEH